MGAAPPQRKRSSSPSSLTRGRSLHVHFFKQRRNPLRECCERLSVEGPDGASSAARRRCGILPVAAAIQIWSSQVSVEMTRNSYTTSRSTSSRHRNSRAGATVRWRLHTHALPALGQKRFASPLARMTYEHQDQADKQEYRSSHLPEPAAGHYLAATQDLTESRDLSSRTECPRPEATLLNTMNCGD